MSDTSSCLLVEHDPDISALLRYHLEQLGYQVRQAEADERAWAHIAEDTPEIAIIDIHDDTPEWRLMIEELRNRSPLRRCWIVGTSTLDSDDVHLDTDAFLSKPFTRADIARALHGAP